jgi:phosphoribulokinase
MEQHVAALADGKPILKPVYNHTTGTFDPPEYIVPKKFVIIEGLLAFHTPALREPFHVKVYLDPPEELRREWKIKRDCAKRGYQREDVLREMEKREHDSATWIRPQKQHADLVVRFHGDTAPVPAEHLSLRLTMRPTLPHPDLSPLTEREQSPLRLTIEREQGRLVEHVELDGSVDPAEAARIEQMIWGQQPEIRQLADRTDGLFADGQETRRSVPLAVSQLLIAYHLLLGRLAKEQLAKSLEQARTASA